MKSFLTQKAQEENSSSNQRSDVAGACCPDDTATATTALTECGENLSSSGFVFSYRLRRF